MQLRSDLVDRATMTVERTAMLLRDLRDELDGADGLGSRTQRELWDAITDLEWRHSLLSDLQLDMLLGPPTQLDERWQRFSICYDDYRESVREVRSALAQAVRGEPGRAAVVSTPATRVAEPQPPSNL